MEIVSIKLHFVVNKLQSHVTLEYYSNFPINKDSKNVRGLRTLALTIIFVNISSQTPRGSVFWQLGK